MDQVQVKTEYDPDHTKMNQSQKVFGELNVLKSADGSALIRGGSQIKLRYLL